ncbi:unnamed protein product [Penicillium egyptiacum]|uniref:Uncharacterized protein n=1 Tax=Penicillium egyptiacum TaxID=1303716 RepID=A0A9W4KGJ2_9EURO|nr:unnamed protein product [Penicillium egyptiacum]
MSDLFCCNSLHPTKLPNPDHEQTFTEFTKWALTTTNSQTGSTDPSEASVCIQLVRQVSGTIESVRYFVASDEHGSFEEVSKDAIVDADFVKIDERESFRCTEHNRSFILHIYEASTGSSSHWRASIARPLKQLENAIKHKISGSGSGSGSGSRTVLESTGSGVGHTASSGYGYGTGMGYGSAWGSSLGSGCGPNWGTGSSTAFDKSVPSSTTVETGSHDSDSDGHNEDQDQDPNQDLNQDPNQDPEISSPGNGTECTNQEGDKDEPVSSLPTIDTEVAQDEDAGSYSPLYETRVTSHDDGRMSQSYLDIEDYGCYYAGRSFDDYGIYDCDPGDIDLTYDQDYRDCGGCDD